MTPVTKEWIDKAEKDFGSAVKLMRARKDPNYDLICFLAQQCVEKYFKALYQHQQMPFDKVHHLPVLLTPLAGKYPQLEIWRPHLERLSLYAVIFRYPGQTASKARAVEAVNWCRSLRGIIRGFLGMAEPTPALKRSQRTRSR